MSFFRYKYIFLLAVLKPTNFSELKTKLADEHLFTEFSNILMKELFTFGVTITVLLLLHISVIV